MNITLIGMSGAGKSFIGAQLAQRLGMEFVDSDVLLSRAFGGRKIQSVLEELGEELYVATEGDIHIGYSRGRDNMLLSPAGSVVYNDVWMNHLKNISKVIYLKVPYETIEMRNRNAAPHAIVGLGKKSLRELYDERAPLYERHAHLIVDRGLHDLENVLQQISRFLHRQKLKSIFPEPRDYHSPQF